MLQYLVYHDYTQYDIDKSYQAISASEKNNNVVEAYFDDVCHTIFYANNEHNEGS